MALTGIRNLDEKILNELDDKDLVNACRVDTKADEYCNDQLFWMNRILTKFPMDLNILKEYKGTRSWSDYYIYDLRKVTYANMLDSIRDGRLDHVLLNKMNLSTVIVMAAGRGQLNIIKYLAEKGYDYDKEAALMNASRNGHLNVVKYLVEHGANIHALNDHALRFASMNNYLDVVEYLVENGADIHAEEDYAVQAAFQYGYMDVVEYLIEMGSYDPR